MRVTLGTPSEFCSGPAAFLDRKFAAPGAKINNISVRPFLPVQWPMLVLTIALTVHMQAIFCEQPSEEKLKSIAFNCGSITLVPQFLLEMNFGAEAATLEYAPVLSPATVSRLSLPRLWRQRDCVRRRHGAHGVLPGDFQDGSDLQFFGEGREQPDDSREDPADGRQR